MAVSLLGWSGRGLRGKTEAGNRAAGKRHCSGSPRARYAGFPPRSCPAQVHCVTLSYSGSSALPLSQLPEDVVHGVLHGHTTLQTSNSVTLGREWEGLPPHTSSPSQPLHSLAHVALTCPAAEASGSQPAQRFTEALSPHPAPRIPEPHHHRQQGGSRCPWVWIARGAHNGRGRSVLQIHYIQRSR